MNKNFLHGYNPEKHVIVPRSNCHLCHGRGFIGTNLVTKTKHPCTCLRLQELPPKENTTKEESNSSCHT